MRQTLRLLFSRAVLFSVIYFCVGTSVSKAQCTSPDTIKPHARCKNITVYLDSTGNVGINPLSIDNFSYDNCYEIIISISHSCFTCAEIGNKSTTLFVSDASGNKSSCTSIVTVLDTMKPRLTLKNITTFYLDATGKKTVNFTDVATVKENCDSVKRALGIRKAVVSNIFPTTQALNFTCADTGYQKIELFAKDSSGNQISKPMTILIKDTFRTCSPKPIQNIAISGTIRNANGVAVETNVVLTNTAINVSQNQRGSDFNFTNLPSGANFNVTASRDSDWTNGVTTYDIALLSRHILGIETFTSPYSLIAADVNRDGTIDALDLLLIRRLVLHLDSKFEGNTSWRFIPQTVPVLSSPNFPLGTISENLQYNALIQNITNANFIAVKIGDVNNSAQTTLNFTSTIPIKK